MKAASKTPKKTELIAAYVPEQIAEAIKIWVGLGDERSASAFIREAAREKLRRDGIKFETTGPVKAAK